MINTERIKEIVLSPIEPNVPNTLWIDTSNPESPELKVVINGAYRTIAEDSFAPQDIETLQAEVAELKVAVGNIEERLAAL